MKKMIMLACVLAACSSRPAPQPEAPRQPSQRTGGLEHGMMNCPSAVEGARTRLRMTPDGVDVIVTAGDPGAQVEIVKLADFHARQDRFSEWPEHTGFHGGPGTIGHCPIVHDGTRVSLSPMLRGVVVHVTALTPDRVKAVQNETTERLASMPSWLPRAAQR
jgi:hypothetical protein